MRFHCGLLAGLSDGRRAGAAAPRLRPWLVDRRGREDVEIARQLHPAASSWSTPTASIRCAISCCASCRSAATAISRTAPWWTGINGDLANDLGNLAQRVLVMINRDCAAHRARARPARQLPTRRLLGCRKRSLANGAQPHGRAGVSSARSKPSGRSSPKPTAMSTSRRRGCCGAADPARMGTVLYTLAETIRHLAILVQPFVPDAAAKLLDQLGGAGRVARFCRAWRRRSSPGHDCRSRQASSRASSKRRQRERPDEWGG